MRIHIIEWPSHANNLAKHIACRWPWLHVEFTNDSLHIGSEVGARVSGSVSLSVATESLDPNTFLVPTAQLTSGTTLMGTLPEIEVGLQAYRALVDALHFSLAYLAKLKVYPEALPCSYCGGSGEIVRTPPPSGRSKKRGPSQRSKCPECKGTGKQQAHP